MSHNSNVVIRSNDADVLVIAIGQAPVSSDVWIEHGFISDSSLAYVHVNSIINFWEWSYTPAFSGRGELRPLNILQQHKDIQQAFIPIDKEDTVSDEVVLQLEKFVCKMYGCRNSRYVDKTRQKQFFARINHRGTSRSYRPWVLAVFLCHHALKYYTNKYLVFI